MRRWKPWTTAFGLGVLLLSGFLAWRGWIKWQPQTIDDPAARQLISQVEQAYSSVSTYSDSGEKTLFGQVTTFKILYKAPGKLFVDVIDHDPTHPSHSTLWCDGKRALRSFGGIDSPRFWRQTYVASTKTTYSKDEHEEAISKVIYPVMDVFEIASLFFPQDIHGLKLRTMVDLRVIGTQAVDGHLCDVLRSKEFDSTIYIDHELHLLRKYQWDAEVTIYHPALGKPIDDGAFIQP
jgi:hypothetical protein